MATTNSLVVQDDSSFLAIDLGRLEHVWVNHPQLVYKWNAKLADAKMALDQARGEADLLEAELNEKVRADPEKYKLDPKKITETAIKITVRRRVAYVEAQENVTALKHKVDVINAACISLEHRKRALESLVSLHGQAYFAAPRARGDNREEMEKVEKAALRNRGKDRDLED